MQEENYLAEAAKISALVGADDIIVLDGYDFNESYQDALISSSKASLVCIDDIHSYPFRADVIINSSGGITPLEYTSHPDTLFYLGPQYTLLRKPFLEMAEKRRKRLKNQDVFICLGGADPGNQTLEVVKFIAGLDN